ncbi:MAG: hypothetical protein Hyperionvirus22_31 [Hyperionvirus sp.]|uniref:Uncharacterized protein n=1 Tax=Hyperionvirus sp. TaxID=2487770 RepID=A0A3G5AAR2_9VIRU|nr:MAG: hypothetical protein Hyperionvirus22_31 [Hyperionvirus sp.]
MAAVNEELLRQVGENRRQIHKIAELEAALAATKANEAILTDTVRALRTEVGEVKTQASAQKNRFVDLVRKILATIHQMEMDDEPVDERKGPPPVAPDPLDSKRSRTATPVERESLVTDMGFVKGTGKRLYPQSVTRSPNPILTPYLHEAMAGAI